VAHKHAKTRAHPGLMPVPTVPQRRSLESRDKGGLDAALQ
jgi:hypothetical protein